MSINLLNVVLLFLGGVIHTFSYGSIEPLIVVAFYFMTVYLVLILTPLGLIPERRMFNRVFSVGFLMSGIAAVYGNQFHDELQMLKDAGNFLSYPLVGQ